MIKKFLRSTILLLLTTSVLISCDPNDNVEPPTGTDPRDGSTWVFKYSTYDEAGNVTATSNQTFKGVEVTIGGSTWINLVNQTTLQPIIAIQKRTEGWWYVSYPGTTSSLWFKYPATLNETYPYIFGTCTVKDINASVTVPAGTYTGCYKVEGNDTNSLEDEFWFSNVGAILIKFNTYDERAAGPASNVYKNESLEFVSFTR